jgi:hypothetical protein
MNPIAPDQGSDVWWAGSDEWEPWTTAPPIRVIGRLPSDDFEQLLLVETANEHPERFLFGIGQKDARPTPGSPIAAVVFEVPSHPDPREPLNLRDLRYRGEVVVSARAEEAPRLSDEDRERRRKGWAF